MPSDKLPISHLYTTLGSSMIFSKTNIFILFTILITPISYASVSLSKNSAQIFLFLGGDSPSVHEDILLNKNISGAQVIYSWKKLEPKKGVYNFDQIKTDLKFMDSIHKKLWIQIQDKSFDPKVVNVPNYLISKEYYGGISKQVDFAGEGKPLGEGWVANMWEPKVRERFQLLLKHLGQQFDGKIAGINLTETAIDLDEKNPPKGFSNDAYFQSVLDNMLALSQSFNQSSVVQYVNFFPGEWNNDHQYMSRLFTFAIKHNIGLGGPDGVPYRKGMMKNSYPFFHQYKNTLPQISIAIQEPDYTYTNPKTGHKFTANEIYRFATEYLGVKVLFWNIQQPQYSQQVIPLLENIHSKKG